ncbi:alpha-hydroxy-acid oxidizing protein [Streptomyces antimycoticus]|uniref:alpha-hydroxy-acid oxidizing protein n=1 Tax=Streptomyces TaxID=1883 RepID=UPI003448FBDC
MNYGEEDLTTLAGNRRAFGRYRLRTRAGIAGADLPVPVPGEALSLPIPLAPTGLVGLPHGTGELGAAQATRDHRKSRRPRRDPA